MSVRFVHTADLHLGSPLRAIGAESGAVRETLLDASYRAFARIVGVAIEEAVDFLVIAGDLYDQELRSVRANRFVVEQLERLDDVGIPCYLSYGNHDPLGEREELLELPSNVHAFGHEAVEIAEYPLEGPPEARILGQSYRTASDSRAMHADYRPPDATIPNIGLLHTGLDPDAGRYAPCSETDLRRREAIHYWALGHIHQQRIYEGDPTIAYPGIPQGRDVTEPATGGSLLVELSTSTTPEIEFVPTAPIVWHDVEIDVGTLDPEPSNLGELEQLLVERAAAIRNREHERHLPALGVETLTSGWAPTGHICRWTLAGRGAVHELLEEQEEAETYLADQLRAAFARERPFVWTESVRNRVSRPLPDIDVLRENDEVIGEFLDIVAELREDGSERERLRATSGDIWFEPADHEDERETQLPLSDDRLEALIDRAESRVIEALVTRREHVDP